MIWELNGIGWNAFFERGDHAVNFEPHDGYRQENTREVMKDLC